MRKLRSIIFIIFAVCLFAAQSFALFTLVYDPLPEGYGWNLSNKIHRDTGEWSTISSTSSHTYIRFDNDLEQWQVDAVDALVADINAQNPEIGVEGNTYVIKDIWEWRAQLESLTGIKFFITYGSSGMFGDNVEDLIYLLPVEEDGATERVLSPNERNSVGNIIKQSFGGWE